MNCRNYGSNKYAKRERERGREGRERDDVWMSNMIERNISKTAYFKMFQIKLMLIFSSDGCWWLMANCIKEINEHLTYAKNLLSNSVITC